MTNYNILIKINKYVLMDLDDCMEIFGLNINPKDLEEAIKAFRFFDKNKTGLLPCEKLQKVYQSLQMNLSETELKQILTENDL